MSESLITSIVVSAIVALVVVRRRPRAVPHGRAVLLKDPDGNVRVEVLAEARDVQPEGMTGLRFLTRQGAHRIGIGTYQDEGTLAILDDTGLPRLGLRLEEGYPHIIFWRHREPPHIGGTRRIVLGLKTDGSHALEFMDDAGTCRASFGVREDGNAFLTFFDATGKVTSLVP